MVLGIYVLSILKYNSDKITPIVDITTIKTLINSTISTPGTTFISTNVKDFYLMTHIPEYEFMEMPIHLIPD